MIKVGIIGLGFMGRGHFQHCQASALAKVTAVADVEADRLDGRLTVQGNIDLGQKPLNLVGVERYQDGADLIERADVDAVFICLPTTLHAPMAIRAARRGKHIFCEKPMARSLEEADEMIKEARKAGVRLMVGHCLRFWPEYRYLKDLVTNRRLGALRSLAMSRVSSAPRWSWRNWERDYATSGSALIDMHIHDVDTIQWLLGRPRSILAQGWNQGCTTGIDLVEATYDYGPEVMVRARGGWLCAPSFGFEAAYDAYFEHGVVRYNGRSSPTLVEYRDGESAPLYPDVTGDAYVEEDRFFLECLSEGRDPAVVISPEEARTSLAMVLAEERSIHEKRPVTLEG